MLSTGMFIQADPCPRMRAGISQVNAGIMVSFQCKTCRCWYMKVYAGLYLLVIVFIKLSEFDISFSMNHFPSNNFH